MFLLIMVMIFYLTFDVLGGTLQDWIANGVDWFTGVSDQALTDWKISPVIHSLIINGIYAGLGTVISVGTIVITILVTDVADNYTASAVMLKANSVGNNIKMT
ncbi:MAG: hypothetical protein ACOCOG_07560, partial [Prevotella sp.]